VKRVIEEYTSYKLCNSNGISDGTLFSYIYPIIVRRISKTKFTLNGSTVAM
jgi:hypothetical protein